MRAGFMGMLYMFTVLCFAPAMAEENAQKRLEGGDRIPADFARHFPWKWGANGTCVVPVNNQSSVQARCMPPAIQRAMAHEGRDCICPKRNVRARATTAGPKM